MANQAGRPIAPARKLVATVLGTIAVFVMALGLGMISVAVVVFGTVLLGLSIALAMVNVVRRGARAWVAGSAEVRAISPAPTSSAVFGRAEILVVLVAPGLPTSEVTIRDPRVPVAKWPAPGDTLPVAVDVDDMRRVRVNWEDATATAQGYAPEAANAAADADARYAESHYADPSYADADLDEEVVGEVTTPWSSHPDDWDQRDREQFDAAAQVVVHETPEGRVLDGEVVDHDDTPPPLPRRAAAVPHTPEADPEPTDQPAAAGSAPPGSAPTSSAPPTSAPTASAPPTSAPTASAPPTSAPTGGAAVAAPTRDRPPGTRPSPHPHRTATATVEPDTTASAHPTRTPHNAATATDPAPANAGVTSTPTQRGPHPDDAYVTDIPLDTPRMNPAPQQRQVEPDADIDVALDGADDRTATSGPPAGIKGLGITVPVTDLSRSVSFYRDMLGFTDVPGGPDLGQRVLTSGDTRLVLRATPGAVRRVHLDLEVGDVPAAYEQLRAKGVEFVEEPSRVPHGDHLELWSATFRDPDDHDITITQWRAP